MGGFAYIHVGVTFFHEFLTKVLFLDIFLDKKNVQFEKFQESFYRKNVHSKFLLHKIQFFVTFSDFYLHNINQEFVTLSILPNKVLL